MFNIKIKPEQSFKKNNCNIGYHSLISNISHLYKLEDDIETCIVNNFNTYYIYTDIDKDILINELYRIILNYNQFDYII